ncbi:MAG TPA: cupin domain-containing protein [Dehalococcoidia bacterium]|nr:cupin domain-containing protein [Dehalococcoidia bacterium]
MTAKHTYLKTHTLAADALSFALPGEDATLHARARASTSGRAARTLVKEDGLRVTLIALRKGAVLSAHRVEGDVTIHVLRGRARVTAQGRASVLASGALLVLRSGVPHAAEALADCALLVTVAMPPPASRR